MSNASSNNICHASILIPYLQVLGGSRRGGHHEGPFEIAIGSSQQKVGSSEVPPLAIATVDINFSGWISSKSLKENVQEPPNIPKLFVTLW